MTVAYSTAGTVAAGSTSLSIPYPTCAAGDMLVVFISNKYPTNGPSAIDGWTQLTSDSSGLSDGTDTGNTRCTIFYKIAAGTESGNLAVTITSGNVSVGRMFCYTKTADYTWDVGYAYASKNALTDPWTTTDAVTAGSNPGLTAGDLLSVCVAINGNTRTMTLQDVTATGVTAWGTMTERQDSGSNNGDDAALMVSEHPVSTGTASANPVFSAELSSAGAGGIIFFRLREVAPVVERRIFLTHA